MDLPSVYPDESYPGFAAPVVVKSHQTGRVACGLARFGLIPSWAKDDKIKAAYRLKFKGRYILYKGNLPLEDVRGFYDFYSVYFMDNYWGPNAIEKISKHVESIEKKIEILEKK